MPFDIGLSWQNDHKTHENTKDDISIVREYKDLVMEEFGPNHPMVNVAKCESNWIQYEIVDNFIKILRGRMTPADIGIFQVNVEYHGEDAKKLGYNIYTPIGNIGFARYLYNKYGLSPWNASKRCWDR